MPRKQEWKRPSPHLMEFTFKYEENRKQAHNQIMNKNCRQRSEMESGNDKPSNQREGPGAGERGGDWKGWGLVGVCLRRWSSQSERQH